MTVREFFFVIIAAIAIAYATGEAGRLGAQRAADVIASDCRNANEAIIRGIPYACRPIFSQGDRL